MSIEYSFFFNTSSEWDLISLSNPAPASAPPTSRKVHFLKFWFFWSSECVAVQHNWDNVSQLIVESECASCLILLPFVYEWSNI